LPETSEENGKTPAAVTTPGIPRKGLERREVEKRIYGVAETLNQSSAAAAGSFAPTLQIEKLEIHTVFLRFPNFNLGQNLSPSALAD